MNYKTKKSSCVSNMEYTGYKVLVDKQMLCPTAINKAKKRENKYDSEVNQL